MVGVCRGQSSVHYLEECASALHLFVSLCKPPSLISVKGRDTMTMLPVVVLLLFDLCGFLFFAGGGINL